MLKKKTQPSNLKLTLQVEKSLLDRLHRVQEVAESLGFETLIEQSVVKHLAGQITRAEKSLGIGSNASGTAPT